MKKLRGFSRQSPGGFIILGNLVFIAGIIVALTIYTRTYRDKMKTQNVIDIGNITESSATVATDFFLTQKTRLDDVSTYVKNTGLGYSATLDFIANSNSDASTVYELIGTDKTGVVALKENGVYPAISYAANKTTNPYASFATFFAPTDEEKALTRLHCSIEYTDAYTAHQSFALYTYLDLSDGTTTSTYTLMSVHRSSGLDELLSTNTTYSDMAIALMKRNGDYLFATSSFKSDNLFRYFYTFNGLSLNQWNSEASLFYNGEKDTFYYNNAQGEAAVFVTKPLDLEGVTWYAVSSVPLSSFHNLASSVWIIATTIALLSGMMIFNFAWMERANHKLKEAAQKEKEAAAKEKEASDAKSDFFSRMSHDIRTPLNVVIGSSTLALKEKNSPTTERYLSDIDQSGKFLLSLVNDLLDLNKVQNGSMTLHLTPYSLKEFSAAMHSIVGPLCEEKHLSLTLEGFDDDTPYLIDAVRFKQIFYNLLSNSVKFTPSGGKISLRASWGEESEGKRKLIIVENDNGIGMSEEFQKKMFDPFSQEDRMQTTGNGTGLGLAIVKSFVTLMSGELNVRSAPGVGTTFALSFPLQKSDTPLKNSTISPQEISGLKDKRILLCEDNPLNAKIAKTLLENKGMKVDLASNGKVGLDRFATSQPHTYDLILMDMRMPVMDGLETAKAIRALSREEAKKIPIVAMTANAYDEDIKACLEAGMNAHLAKPVDPTAMYEEIAKQLFLKK
jgi:signal transduction histidine kinase/CheY-like chemotaxis protein